MKIWKFFLFCFLLVGLVAGTLSFAWFFRPLPYDKTVLVLIPKKSGVHGVSQRLAEVGLTQNPALFEIFSRLWGFRKVLKAGEYLFKPHLSPYEILSHMWDGKVFIRKLTVPEGMTSFQVISLLNTAPALEGTIESIPEEGSLFPDTYYYSYGDHRRDLLTRMKNAMKKTLTSIWKEKNASGISSEKCLILASIVEKETALPQERPLVAAVFLNRLRKGIPLQADPTIIYALTQGKGPLRRLLSRTDLLIASPFNTYQTTGLPPTPICNPGVSSLKAVLNPAVTEALYFVANGDGGHTFSNTLEAHQHHHQKWRKIRRK